MTGAGHLLITLDAQGDEVSISLSVEVRIELAVDQAHELFLNTMIKGLVHCAKLRSRQVDLRGPSTESKNAV
ncbi:hypothetical protein AUR04nite_35190 [Glutamicibacter uratoxydans]|uniref:Uncharacterized protein n=1 Tax=Glutamicibacter uratoxydans TaxID=43667 RepID=A0A4Y4DTM7_GLUUR|nr:hypothetical protein AUR04nite_35190 [Glutamicibacter uratoxydans]